MNKELIDLLDLSKSNNEQDLEKNFNEIAETFLLDWCIVKNNIRYYINEIEFYYYHSAYHQDSSVYCHFLKRGNLRAHSSGLDITFDSFWGGKERQDILKKIAKKGVNPDFRCTKKIENIIKDFCNNNVYYGGILIRQIQCIDDDFHIIEGSWRTLFELINMEDNTLNISFEKFKKSIKNERELIKPKERINIKQGGFENKKYNFSVK